MISLVPAAIPAFLKIGFFGDTGSGKTFTAAKVMSQFIAEYYPGGQLAMFDTEPSAGYVAAMVKKITGKELLAIPSRSFSELVEFANLVREKKYVAILDSATHPWRQLCTDYLTAKKSRVAAANGNVNTVRLTLKDWGPIKDMWAAFSQMYCYDPVHWCLNGREGDKWEEVENEEGKMESTKTGVKMKTETETGYEPSLLVQMRLADTSDRKNIKQGHFAHVVKDRFDALTGQISDSDPDIEFFRPHIELLDLKGGGPKRNPNPEPSFKNEVGRNWETIQAERKGILALIADDMFLALPGQTADMKKKRIEISRAVFGGDVTFDMIEADEKKWPADILRENRKILQDKLKEATNATKTV